MNEISGLDVRPGSGAGDLLEDRGERPTAAPVTDSGPTAPARLADQVDRQRASAAHPDLRSATAAPSGHLQTAADAIRRAMPRGADAPALTEAQLFAGYGIEIVLSIPEAIELVGEAGESGGSAMQRLVEAIERTLGEP